MLEKTIFSRREFYDYIWSTPLTVQARDYGLTEIRMAEICARYVVPCPPRGFWKRRPAGTRKPRQRPFPSIGDPFLGNTIVLQRRLRPEVPSTLETQLAGIRSVEKARGQIRVPDYLPENPHPLLKRLIVLMAKANPGVDGLVRIDTPPVFLELTNSTIDRAFVPLNN